jgi:hypothetical protein
MPTSEQTREGQITASVDVVAFHPDHRDLGDPHKLRVIVWSGADFRTPTRMTGRVCDTRAEAETLAADARSACEMLGIPVL